VRRTAGQESMIVGRTKLLVVLLAVQLLLGASAWVTNYGWPMWFKDYVWTLQYRVVAEGPLQAAASTAHAAVGALNLVAAWSLCMWSHGLPQTEPRAKPA